MKVFSTFDVTCISWPPPPLFQHSPIIEKKTLEESHQKYTAPDNLKCNNCKVLKLRRDTAQQLRICDEQFWDLRVPTDGGDTEFPDT